MTTQTARSVRFVHDIVAALGGSFCAEHGIGGLMRQELVIAGRALPDAPAHGGARNRGHLPTGTRQKPLFQALSNGLGGRVQLEAKGRILLSATRSK